MGVRGEGEELGGEMRGRGGGEGECSGSEKVMVKDKNKL